MPKAKIEYTAKFVNAKVKNPKTGICKLNKLTTSNCSKGEKAKNFIVNNC